MSNDTFSERLAYPKGLKGIIANESALSDVLGEEGRLLYLGYDIDDLVEMCCFEEREGCGTVGKGHDLSLIHI